MNEASRSGIVLGTWGLAGAHGGAEGPMGYGAVASEVAIAVLSAAHAAGIRTIDTAPSYGGGEAHRRIGQWRRSTGLSFDAVVKPGRPLVKGKPVSRLGIDALIEEIAEAKAELGSASVILLKDPPREALIDGTVESRIEAIERSFPGSIGGFASHDLAFAAQVRPTSRPRVAQIEYHGINYAIARRTAAELRAKGWSVWGMQPLAYGFLTERAFGDRPFGADDFRSRIPERQRILFQRAACSFLNALAERAPPMPVAQLALAFCFSEALLDRVVIGPKSLDQLNDALAALELAKAGSLREAIAGLSI